QPALGVGRGGQDRPLQQLVLAGLLLMSHALLDPLEGASLEEVGGPHLVSRREQPVRGLPHRRPEAVGRVDKHEGHGTMVPAGATAAGPGRTRNRTHVTGSAGRGPVRFADMDDVLRPLIVVGGSVLLTLLLGWATDRLLRKADERHHDTPLWGLLRRARIPWQLVLCAALLRASYVEARV